MTTMTGSTSNITTQWTFRDGRDYILSLTTTELPNTVSFWITDKITAEEWTASYDENGIEVITKRTGCYKSFQTFLSMIKSAILKKSEAIILELLNIEDLTAISLHRQHGGGRLLSSSSAESRTLSPLNFQLYSGGETNSSNGDPPPSTSQFSQNPNKNPQQSSSTGPGAEARSSHTGNGNPTKASDSYSSPLNKRKYLIVTYIAEFDKVHYPLPLNYSNPPDLNAMQRNIMSLKAEVVSLQSAKKDLATELQAMKSGPLSQQSHHGSGSERNGNQNQDKAGTRAKSSSPTSRKGARSESLEPGGGPPRKVQERKGADHGLGDPLMHLDEFQIPDAKELSTVFCQRCSGTIGSLRAKIRDLEQATDFQKEEHMQAMEGLGNENHFLRHKVEASEKYEMELWNQIQTLKEKVAELELDLGKEKQLRLSLEEECKELRKARPQSHRSRHDIFYRSYKFPPPETTTPTKKKATPKISNSKSGTVAAKRPCSVNSQQSRRSNSTGSYCSVVSVGPHIDNSEREARHSRRPRSRSPLSPYHPRNYIKDRSRARLQSPSPGSKSRFDPTAYVAEKKKKQSNIASQRLHEIESRLRSNSRNRTRSVSEASASRVSRGISTERAILSRNLPSSLDKRSQRRSSGRGGGVDYEPNNNFPMTLKDNDSMIHGTDPKKDEKRLGKSEKRRKQSLVEDDPQHDRRLILLNKAMRPFSADSEPFGVTRVVSVVQDGRLPSSSGTGRLTKTKIRPAEDPSPARVRNDRSFIIAKPRPLPTLNTPDYIAEINKRVLESTDELLSLQGKQTSRKGHSKRGKVSLSEEHNIESIMKTKSITPRKQKQMLPEEEENYDITQLQTKLSALQAFLETCKPPQEGNGNNKEG